MAPSSMSVRLAWVRNTQMAAARGALGPRRAAAAGDGQLLHGDAELRVQSPGAPGIGVSLDELGCEVDVGLPTGDVAVSLTSVRRRVHPQIAEEKRENPRQRSVCGGASP
jgi:hypothetical protein